MLLPDGRVFAVGKTDVASLLDRADLHRVASIEHVCGSDPDGTPAYDGAAHRMLVPCRGGGIQVVDLAAMRLGPVIPGPNGSPFLARGVLWAVDYDRGELFAADPARAVATATVPLDAPLPHFATPVVAGERVLVGTSRGVTAVRTAIGR